MARVKGYTVIEVLISIVILSSLLLVWSISFVKISTTGSQYSPESVYSVVNEVREDISEVTDGTWENDYWDLEYEMERENTLKIILFSKARYKPEQFTFYVHVKD